MKPLKIIEKQNLWYAISIFVIVIGFAKMSYNILQKQPALNYGIDFLGGTTLNLKFDKLTEALDNAPENSASIKKNFIESIRQELNQFGMEKAQIQITSDQEVLIKTLVKDVTPINELRVELAKNIGPFELLEIDYIGPTIGKELRESSLWIIACVSIVLLLYISWRFQWTYGIAALAALFHDALATLSFASLLNIEVNTAFVAALLTILGYSINDTIVVFDRIRENLSGEDSSVDLVPITNLSIQQTMLRSLNTSGTTMIMLLALMLFGGATINAFVTVLFIGIACGTYSSIFIASPIFVKLRSR